MKLIVLYGPPAVGKLTIAKELSRRTGYKIFHNHLTIDLVESIFTWGTKDFNNLVSKYRLELIEAAAARNVNLVFTIVYAGISDDQFIKEVKENENKLHEVKMRLEKAVADQSNMNNIIAELESKTKQSIEKYLELKKEQLTEREHRLKIEISQKKDNLEISLIQKLYLKIMNNIIDNTKKEIKGNKELQNKIENKLIDNQL